MTAATETGRFDAMYLPDAIKKELALGLLAEFGATKVNMGGDGELIHCCVMPWHDEKRPSASLNFKKLVYNCLGCQAHGGLLWLIGTCRDVDGLGAREWVETQTGLGGSDFDMGAMLNLIDAVMNEQISGPPPIPAFAERALDPWLGVVHPLLTTGVPELGMTGRGIDPQTLIEMKVGWAEAYPMGKDEDGNPKPPSERFVIPHFWKGKLVGWQTRRVWDDGTEKYKSTPDFPKDRTIYNHDPKRCRTAVVVESPMSVLRRRHHMPPGHTIVATFGAEITDTQILLLSEYDRVIWWPDNDMAGWKATVGWTSDGDNVILGRHRFGEFHPGIERLEAYTQVDVVDSPWAADAADVDDATAEALIADAVPLPIWTPPRALRCWACKTEHTGACP